MKQEESTELESPKRPNDKKRHRLVTLLMIVILVVVPYTAAYWWRGRQADTDRKKEADKISQLQKQVDDLKKQLSAKSSSSQEPTSTSTAAVQPSANTIENIKASITSDNTAALEGYMAPTVKVILAASEGIGDRTPAQAVSDLKYLDSATDPWDFALPAATLSGYSTGDYAQYFPSTAVVGKSANDYVVSFTFDSSAKISGIFISSSADLL